MEFNNILNERKTVILNNRHYFMGIAMLLVVLYHGYCATEDVLYLPFKRGYIGVDIFLYFSGLGLCYSYEKNALSNFYKRRLIRILPLYFVWAFIHYLYNICINGIEYSSTDVLCLLTTVSYYGVGSVRSNWYLSALLLLYLLFPFFYRAIKYAGLRVVTFLLISSFFLLSVYDFEWYHSALIGRIYIFSLGVFSFFLFKNVKLKSLWIFLFASLVVGGQYIIFARYQFLGSAIAAPMLILVLALMPMTIVTNKPIKYIGEKSLEIFVANCFVMLTYPLIATFLEGEYGGGKILALIYLFLNIIYSVPVIYINKVLQSLAKVSHRSTNG